MSNILPFRRPKRSTRVVTQSLLNDPRVREKLAQGWRMKVYKRNGKPVPYMVYP